MDAIKAIKEWFFPKEYLEPKESLKELIEYIPVGNIEAVAAWIEKNIPYHHDIDANGKYDATQNYNGAELTLKMKHGDCESKNAVASELIRAWKDWQSGHLYFKFIDKDSVKCAHDICWFKNPKGALGWIDKKAYFGGLAEIRAHYMDIGWIITEMYYVNDIGERIA